MKNSALIFTFILILTSACSGRKTTSEGDTEVRQKSSPLFGKLLDTAGFDGTILVYDPSINTWFSNDFQRCDTGYIPASTFKIVNSIIGIETGVISNEHHVFQWNGERYPMKNWEQDLELKDAFRYSCVPCYRGLARSIGRERMEKWLLKLNFGDMVVDSIDLFWLWGKSRITAFEQVDFMRRFNEGKLAIKPETRDLMRKIMVADSSADYILRGKTGWGLRDHSDILWFTGFAETQKDTVYVCLATFPKKGINAGTLTGKRQHLALQALKTLGYIR